MYVFASGLIHDRGEEERCTAAIGARFDNQIKILIVNAEKGLFQPEHRKESNVRNLSVDGLIHDCSFRIDDCHAAVITRVE